MYAHGGLGIRVKYHHHEVGGPGQLEIEVELGEMVDMADKTMITKYIVKMRLPQKAGPQLSCPSLFIRRRAAECIMHMLLFKDGKPVFYDKDGYSSLSREAHYFIGACWKYAFPVCMDESIHQFL